MSKPYTTITITINNIIILHFEIVYYSSMFSSYSVHNTFRWVDTDITLILCIKKKRLHSNFFRFKYSNSTTYYQLLQQNYPLQQCSGIFSIHSICISRYTERTVYSQSHSNGMAEKTFGVFHRCRTINFVPLNRIRITNGDAPGLSPLPVNGITRNERMVECHRWRL